MRKFEPPSVRNDVIIHDDALKLPSDVNDLMVHFFHSQVEDAQGRLKVYQDDGSLICYSNKQSAHLQCAQEYSDRALDDLPVNSSSLGFVILMGRQEGLFRVVVRA